MTRYAVRKLDIEDRFFYIVDLTVEGAALIPPDSVVGKSPSYWGAQDRCRELNARWAELDDERF